MKRWKLEFKNLNELIQHLSTSGTCNASSRVGVNINARRGPLTLLFDKALVDNIWFAVEIWYFSSSSKRRWRIVMTNARVFPEPVSAAPIMSWNNKGICYSYVLPVYMMLFYSNCIMKISVSNLPLMCCSWYTRFLNWCWLCKFQCSQCFHDFPV
jgi:hypothetical protein